MTDVLGMRRFARVLNPGKSGPQCVCLVCGTDYYVSEAPRRCAKVPHKEGQPTPCHEVTRAEYVAGTR